MLFDQDLRIPQSISNFSSKVLRALALTSALSLVSINGLAYANTSTDTDKETDREAIKQFQLETAPLTERARQLSRRHREQMESFSNKLDQYQDARPLLQDALIGEMAFTADKMLTLTNEYLPRYRAFLARIDKNSSCYQPKRLEQFQQTRDEVQDYLNQLQGLTHTQEQGEAYAALMAITIGQSRAAVLVNLLETSKLCYVTQAMPAVAQDILLLEGLMAERLPEIVEAANLSASEPEGQAHSESSLSEMSSAKSSINVPDLNGTDIESADASRTDYNAPGPATSGSTSADSDKLDQQDEALDACIAQQVSQLGLTSAQALTVLSCRLSSASVSLNRLSKLANLEMLSLQGGVLADLSPQAMADLMQRQASMQGLTIMTDCAAP